MSTNSIEGKSYTSTDGNSQRDRKRIDEVRRIKEIIHYDRIIADDCQSQIYDHIKNENTDAVFILGDALQVTKSFPDNSIDCIVTSPPYWGMREYESGGLGMEKSREEYINKLLLLFADLRRILKPSGSLWLNVGDKFEGKGMLGIPWRIALKMIDDQDWILRSEIIWSKSKGPSNSRDRFRNTHEQFFHFTKEKYYYFDALSVSATPRTAKVVNGRVISATGITGQSYRRKIELSTLLTNEQKMRAYEALDETLMDVRIGKLHDFRMVINGSGRSTNGNTNKVSGRAKQLESEGFYFLKYHPDGTLPGDVWDITPVDTHQRKLHFAPFPEDLIRQPILATCPIDGVVLDPFVGTGTTCLVAHLMGRKSVGIDMSLPYLLEAEKRIGERLF